MDIGTVLVNIPQEDSPALLVSTTHTTSDLLSAVTLKNVSEMRLFGCRLGWVVVFPSGKSEIHMGLPMNIPAGVEAGAPWRAPAQSVTPEFANQGASAIAFFVAEAFPSSVMPWKADLVRMRRQARIIALKTGAKS